MGKIEVSASWADMIVQCNMMSMIVLPLLPPEKGVVRIVGAIANYSITTTDQLQNKLPCLLERALPPNKRRI